MALAPGSRIGSHEVLSLIGQGGMGEVYKARDTTLDREVAIKRLPEAVAGDPDRLARFEREALALAALNHPNVAQIYAVEAGSIVMELVPGAPISGPLPLETALEYAAQIASALDAAHQKGIVHRDLKPGNVMVTTEGVVKVLDFSLAARDRIGADGDPDQSPTLTAHHTSAGMIMGTAAYMAPEQASGKPVDKRADIFAFGVVLWEILTGRRMFEGETISHVLAAVLTQEPDLSVVPLRVRHLLARCLEKDPRKRLRDIGDAMSLVLPPGSVSPGPAAEMTPARRRAARTMAIGGWIVAAMLAVALVAVAWPRRQTAVAASAQAVRFQIARTPDIYNQSPSAFAVSPDGLMLAYYEASADGQHALYVRTLATGEVRELPDTRTFSPRLASIFWSADSREIVRGTQSGAFVIDVSAGASRPLCDCRFVGGAWSADGTILLGGLNLGEGIRRVSATDRSPVAVTQPDATLGQQDRWPSFLPDGRFVFTRTTASGEATFVGTLDGSEPRRVVDGSRRVFVPALAGSGPFLLGIDAAGGRSRSSRDRVQRCTREDVTPSGLS